MLGSLGGELSVSGYLPFDRLAVNRSTSVGMGVALVVPLDATDGDAGSNNGPADFTVSQVSPLRTYWHSSLRAQASRQVLGEGDDEASGRAPAPALGRVSGTMCKEVSVSLP
jgi:hypothetical protein